MRRGSIDTPISPEKKGANAPSTTAKDRVRPVAISPVDQALKVIDNAAPDPALVVKALRMLGVQPRRPHPLRTSLSPFCLMTKAWNPWRARFA